MRGGDGTLSGNFNLHVKGKLATDLANEQWLQGVGDVNVQLGVLTTQPTVYGGLTFGLQLDITPDVWINESLHKG